jgi:hypothetical protein
VIIAIAALQIQLVWSLVNQAINNDPMTLLSGGVLFAPTGSWETRIILVEEDEVDEKIFV